MPPTRFQVRAREKIDTPDTLKRYFDEWNEGKTMLSAEGEKQGCTKESLLRNRAATIFQKTIRTLCVVRAAHNCTRATSLFLPYKDIPPPP